MSELSKEYKRIVGQISSTITNEEERKIVLEKVEELSSMFINKIETLNTSFDKRIKKVEDNEKVLSLMFNHMQLALNEIQSDIYEEGEDMNESEYDFEIVCPYCNTEFVTDASMINQDQDEIKCPACSNVIELDWGEDEEDNGCQGHCHGCHGCGSNDNDEDDDM